jgi:hypothetical protein
MLDRLRSFCLMAKQRDKNNDGDRYAEKQKQNGTHWVLSGFKTVMFLFDCGLDLNGHDVISLPSTDCGGKAGAEGPDE